MIVLKITGLVIWLLIIPFCMGLFPAYRMPEEDRTPGIIFLSGYFVMFALFELIGIPVVIFVVYHGFTWLSYLFLAACMLVSFSGLLLAAGQRKRGGMPVLWRGAAAGQTEENRVSTEEKLYYLLFLLLVFFQLYMAFTRASFDGDDAYYNVQGVIAGQLDSLYRINPYTGRSAPLDTRHALALIPIWEAFIGKMSGIHATVIAHSVIPLVFLPLTYLLYYQIGKRVLGDKKDMLPVFMILLALWQMFGNVSIYTNETFFLTRTWQGKSLTGNFILPAVFLLFLKLFEKDRKGKAAGYWLLLACVNLAAGASSSLAVLLCSLLTAGLAVLFAVREKSFWILVKAGLTCLPGAAYVLVYLIISH